MQRTLTTVEIEVTVTVRRLVQVLLLAVGSAVTVTMSVVVTVTVRRDVQVVVDAFGFARLGEVPLPEP